MLALTEKLKKRKKKSTGIGRWKEKIPTFFALLALPKNKKIKKQKNKN
jgi:hypothetical protein